MRYYEDFTIDGKPMLVPDADVQIEKNDLDSQDSGRDESGVMHRVVVRERVRKWAFSYSVLTAEEYQYMESLFAGKSSFTFSFRETDGKRYSCMAYCANHSITLHNARTGTFKNYNFNIIEC